ncbi:UPF0721 transmembrane protein [Methylobacterium oxalidis]|uniref:Probable membrane transporter protein n=1 Tax=Methylobacterium oxalidis TaxID=944322 RepID=A0A512J8A2_9HYPH|nr:UPF0721 transmembrane protein [Methylobacterium oxalidis]GJE34573.1 hypothetical protein LDDCCGHA_4785 [Methylobacterium oxalidis]GLS65182.1 UPF0721 transmembrane protein [Methylobacterium oxalidis]
MSGGWILSLTPTLVGIGLVAGLMIGCVGVGGVILVPLLTFGCGVPVATAAAAAMMGYIATGLTGTLLFGRSGAIDRKLALELCLGAAPGALFGAWAIQLANPVAVQILIAALAAGAGVNSLSGRLRGSVERCSLSTTGAVGIGVAIGIVSAMTGTGGPVVLVPLLMWLGFPVLAAVGLGQAIQLPVAGLATAGSYLVGSLDAHMGAQLAIGLVVGSVAGAKLAHGVTEKTLHATAALILVATGVMVVLRLFASSLPGV